MVLPFVLSAWQVPGTNYQNKSVLFLWLRRPGPYQSATITLSWLRPAWRQSRQVSLTAILCSLFQDDDDLHLYWFAWDWSDWVVIEETWTLTTEADGHWGWIILLPFRISSSVQESFFFSFSGQLSLSINIKICMTSVDYGEQILRKRESQRHTIPVFLSVTWRNAPNEVDSDMLEAFLHSTRLYMSLYQLTYNWPTNRNL